MGTVVGTSFAVWAPRAQAVRVVGDFNGWDSPQPPDAAARRVRGLGAVHPRRRRRHPLQVRDPRRRRQGAREGRPDGPRAPSCPPGAASVVVRVRLRVGRRRVDGSSAPGSDPHTAADERLRGAPRARGGSGAQLPRPRRAPRQLRRRPRLHPRRAACPSWSTPTRRRGATRSPATTPRARGSARPDDFRYLVDRLHQAGIGVILDWVPGHFPRDAWALARFDGLPLYEHADPRRGWQPDWGSYIFDFGRHAGAQLPRRQRGLLAGGVPHRRPAGRRAWPRCSTSTTPARTASGSPTSTAAARTSRRSACSRRPTPRHTSGCPGIVTIAEESTSWPGVTKPTSTAASGSG